VLGEASAVRLWHLDKGTDPNVSRPFAFPRALYKLRVTEEFTYRLNARFSSSDGITQKISKTWRRRTPLTRAVLKQDEVIRAAHRLDLPKASAAPHAPGGCTKTETTISTRQTFRDLRSILFIIR
jgi:hypothetical protein